MCAITDLAQPIADGRRASDRCRGCRDDVIETNNKHSVFRGRDAAAAGGNRP